MCAKKCSCTPGACTCKKDTCVADTCAADTCADIHKITAEQLKEKIDTGAAIVVNVLEADYYDDCHIASSINVPLSGLKEACDDWDKDKKIVVYCARHECEASKEAAKLLTSLGFSKVCCYEGGTKEWHQKGFACDGPCTKDYLK